MTNRQKRILAILEQQRFLTISQISQTINYSPSTIRRDLNKLEEQNLVRRTHGGALFIKPNEIEMPTEVKENIHIKQKKYIAELATGYIQEHQTIFLDGSSTILAFAHSLIHFNNLTIVTNNMETAIFLSLNSNNKIDAVGGTMNDVLASSSSSLEYLRNFSFDACFFSCRGVDRKYGITERLENEAVIKRIVSEHAKNIFLLADSSKMNKKFPYICCQIHNLTSLITNKKPDNELLNYFETNNVEVYY